MGSTPLLVDNLCTIIAKLIVITEVFQMNLTLINQVI